MALEGRFGVLSAYFGLGEIDAAATASRPLAPEEIEEVVVEVPEPAIPLVLEPREAKIAPRTDYDAKFSLQFSVAALLVHRDVGVTTYTESGIRDRRVLELARRVRYEVRHFDSYPAAFPGAVRIRTKQGPERTAEVPYQRGGPENPMSADEVREKFSINVALALDEATSAALEAAILSIEDQEDLRSTFAPLGKAAGMALRTAYTYENRHRPFGAPSEGPTCAVPLRSRKERGSTCAD